MDLHDVLSFGLFKKSSLKIKNATSGVYPLTDGLCCHGIAPFGESDSVGTVTIIWYFFPMLAIFIATFRLL
jgi:hypothetical protein